MKNFYSNNALIMTAVVLVLYGFSHGFIVKDFIWFASLRFTSSCNWNFTTF